MASEKEITVDIGIFAYNEEESIDRVLFDLAAQSFWMMPGVRGRIFLLANGCIDKTVSVATETVQSFPPEIRACFHIFDLPFKGKSKTWNYFVHHLLCDNTNFVLFMDGDICMPNSDHVERMLRKFDLCAELVVFNSRPVKQIPESSQSSLVAKLIGAMGGNFSNYQSSVCGQCYMVRAERVKSISMPVGLPVEDGFIRAMLLTDCLTRKEDLRRIWGEQDVWHKYESITSVGQLIGHQVRILIGSAINVVVFSELVDSADDYEGRLLRLKQWGEDENALSEIIERRLPRRPYGYVPFSFLTKRWRQIVSDGLNIKKMFYGVIGILFDFVTYLIASIKMIGGKGSGYW